MLSREQGQKLFSMAVLAVKLLFEQPQFVHIACGIAKSYRPTKEEQKLRAKQSSKSMSI